jgi:putative hydrolase of the HAD superfamily
VTISAQSGLFTPQAILFDMDDTIIDDSNSVEPAWRSVCKEAAKQVQGLEADVLLSALAPVRRGFWSDPDRHREGRLDLREATARIVDEALRSLGYDLPELARNTAHTYRDLREAGVRPFPRAVETLEGLRAMGVRLGLITNGSGPGQRAKVERFDLARHFDHILIEGEFGCGKPDERVYLTTMRALRSQPEQTWSVGDNLEWDIAAPQRLALYALWVDGSGAGLPAGSEVRPDRIIRSIAELVSARTDRR